MSFHQAVKVPDDRIGVIIGKEGKVKDEIQERCKVLIRVDSESGNVMVSPHGSVPLEQAFKAVEIISAISKGFSPERAYRLFTEDIILQVIDLNDYAGRSHNDLARLKGRIIGEGGKSRKTIEDLTGTSISIYGHTVSIIGSFQDTKLATDAILHLVKGSSHKTVYNALQDKKRQAKVNKLFLWEDKNLKQDIE